MLDDITILFMHINHGLMTELVYVFDLKSNVHWASRFESGWG
jgi:hypothetical protein